MSISLYPDWKPVVGTRIKLVCSIPFLWKEAFCRFSVSGETPEGCCGDGCLKLEQRRWFALASRKVCVCVCVGGGAGGAKEEAKGDPQHHWRMMSLNGQAALLPPDNDICQPPALWGHVIAVSFGYGTPRSHPRRIALFWSLYRTGWMDTNVWSEGSLN